MPKRRQLFSFTSHSLPASFFGTTYHNTWVMDICEPYEMRYETASEYL